MNKTMANGIYTALDQDIDYLAHWGVKGMKWYKHLFGLQQSLNKYAKGTNTEGIELNKAMAKAAIQRAKAAKESGDRKAMRYNIDAAKAATKRAKELEKADKRSRIPRKLAGAAASVIGIGLKAADRAYSTYQHTKNFIKNPRYRKVKLSEFKKSVKSKANAFTKAISSIPGKIKTTYDEWNKKRGQRKRSKSSSRNVPGGRALTVM